VGRSTNLSDLYPPLSHEKPYLPAEDAWDKIIHEDWKDRGYAIRSERIGVQSNGDHEEKWDTEGPTRGDTVFIWVHGWQNEGANLLPWQSGAGPVEATVGGRKNAILAWDAIDYYTSIADAAEDNDSVHTVAFAWNSASASANFNSAVGQAARYGPRNLAPFLMDLGDRVGPRGTIHIGAHSLGCWITLEALAKAHYENSSQLYSALKSVRFICAAVPHSSIKDHRTRRGGDGSSHWVNCQNNGRSYPCWGPEPYRNESYDKHALLMPNRIKNVYYPGDDVLRGTFAPFPNYLRTYSGGSTVPRVDPGVGAIKASPSSYRNLDNKWENVEATNVENHSNSYKHPAYAGDAGCGQNVIWSEWVDVGRECEYRETRGIDRSEDRDRDRDRDRSDRRGGSGDDSTGGYGGGGYGGGGGDDELTRIR